MRKSLVLLAALALAVLTANAASARGGKSGKVGGNVVVTPAGSTIGAGKVRNVPLNQVNIPVNPTTRPTGPGPCTVHCGPLGGRGKR
jgi:hypothetical protein